MFHLNKIHVENKNINNSLNIEINNQIKESNSKDNEILLPSLNHVETNSFITPVESTVYSDSISSLSSSEISFSSPIFYTCEILPAKKSNKNIQINNENNKFNVLKSSSNMCYLEVEKLKKAKYGEVVKAYQLYPIENTQNTDNNETNFKYKKRQIVAIKKYLKSQVSEQLNVSQENPMNEMLIMQKFSKYNCENIMNVIECMEDNKYYYMVLPFSTGGDIIDYIGKHGPMNESKAKSFFLQLMNGINFMHEMGVAHRDLTSENVLCDYDKHTFTIIDFGACVELKENRYGDLIESMDCLPIFGKKNYIAPEVFNQNPKFFPLKVDIWSAGIILFIVLTGHPPMEIATNEDKRFRILADKSKGIEYMLNLWNMNFNSELIDLFNKMLDPNPISRISAENILKHPWLSKNNESNIHIAPQA